MYRVPSSLRDFLQQKFPRHTITYTASPERFSSEEIEVYWGNRLPPNFYQQLTNLKWIHFGSVGFDRYEKSRSFLDRDLLVTNSSDIATDAIETHTMYQLFSLIRQSRSIEIARQNNTLSRLSFENSSSNIRNIRDLSILIVGFGNIGRRLANSFLSLKANVNVVSNKFSLQIGQFPNYHISQLSEIIGNYDCIISVLPFKEELIGIFDEGLFKNMRKGSYFINNGRGSHVKEMDLIKALEDTLAGAALDVFETNTLYKNNPLFLKENVILTPHIGALDLNYWTKQKEIFVYNLERYINFDYKHMKNICYGVADYD